MPVWNLMGERTTAHLLEVWGQGLLRSDGRNRELASPARQAGRRTWRAHVGAGLLLCTSPYPAGEILFLTHRRERH